MRISEVLVLSPVGRKELSLKLSVPGMSILELLPNPACQVLCLNPIKFGLTQSTVQVVDHLVVSVKHVQDPGARKFIGCVHHDIPQDLNIAMEESSHPPLPHLVVSTIKVWRTRTPFQVRHL
jgi:hypothetical protein